MRIAVIGHREAPRQRSIFQCEGEGVYYISRRGRGQFAATFLFAVTFKEIPQQPVN